MPSFRGNHDHSIRSFRTVKSRRRSILQHVDTFNILRIQPGDSITDTIYIIRIIQLVRRNLHRILHDHTIYDPQRFPIPDQRRSSPNPNFRGNTRFTRIRHHHQIRDLPFQHLVQRRYSRNHDILHFYRRHSTR